MKTQKKSDADRLSALPDHLLLHIIQYMTTKHSAQTCVLSKRWKNLWKYVTNIKLHHFGRYNGVIFDKFVSGFLSGRDNSLPLHSISYVNRCLNYVGYISSHENCIPFHCISCVNRCMHYPFPPKTNIPVEIMEYAASHNVQQLKIKSKIDRIRNLELPPSIFNCNSLTSLNLCLWNENTPATIMFPKSLNLPALKTLKLSCFQFFTNENGYAEPFSTFNMLSKLAIFACNIQDNAQGLCISNSEVSNLAIGEFSPDTNNIHKVILCTPKLISLTVNGATPAFQANTCNLTLLEELKFDCPHDNFTMDENILISWLHLLAAVERMTLNIVFLIKMVNVLKNNGSTIAQLPSFVKLKSLKVECYSHTCDESVREMVTYLLQNSPPPSTFLISKEIDPTFDRSFFIGILFVDRAKVIKICEKCGYGEATFYALSLREGGQRIFYTCTSCGHDSQEYI